MLFENLIVRNIWYVERILNFVLQEDTLMETQDTEPDYVMGISYASVTISTFLTRKGVIVSVSRATIPWD